MLCIVFYLNLRLKYVIKYLFLFFCKYPWILKNYVSTHIMDTRRIWVRVRRKYLPVDIPIYG